MNKNRLIETDTFPFEFLSQISERESWRKEIHRPIYHIHKWWAKRLGSVFRGILLGSMLPDGDLQDAFYRRHDFAGVTVFDPFMGSGTTIGEAHKLGFTALGRDINPVAVNAVKVALGPMDRTKLRNAFSDLSVTVGEQIRNLYRSVDSQGRACDVLYYFWVMQASCPDCASRIDLFSSYVMASNAYPKRKPEVQIVCPSCGDIFVGMHGTRSVSCKACKHQFDPTKASAKGQNATCFNCKNTFSIIDSLKGVRPSFRLYAKLVLTEDNRKEYLAATESDQIEYEKCSRQLETEVSNGNFSLPALTLDHGYNTRQAMSYGFRSWRDFFNDRQLLALAYLRNAITKIQDTASRDALLTLFSGVLEFNNMFTSYKGEGTGAVRHMFAHHILKPERVPIEANVWGTPKSSGSFSGLFRGRLLRAFEYRLAPKEVNGTSGEGLVCAPPFSGGTISWPTREIPRARVISLSCGDSATSGLPNESIDLVVTDPPFFDNVHYSELADFFYAWHQDGNPNHSTRSVLEVQDTSAAEFARKLHSVFVECHRVLKENGLLVFTYHHSRDEGWEALAEAVIGSGFVVVNSQPVKSEMSVATPKAQTKEPIQLDIILVCRKNVGQMPEEVPDAIQSGWNKLRRLEQAGLRLSQKDKRIVLQGQMLTTLRSVEEHYRVLGSVDEAFKGVVNA